jgi:hypothetical protein
VSIFSDSFVRPRQFSLLRVLGFLVLAACRATDGASRSPLVAGAVAGCYQFSYSDGRPIPSSSGFWAAPVRLDTALALLDGDGGYRTEPGIFVVVPTGPLLAVMDTTLTRSTWRVLPPDTLLVIRSTGFEGQALRLRARGAALAGVERRSGDVIDTAHPPQEKPVVARRVSCPKSGG